MDVIFDDHGYPNKINLDKELKSLLEQGSNVNWFTLEKFYNLVKPIIEYWQELNIYSENRKYGEISKAEYQKLVNKFQKKYFKKEIEKVRYYSNYYQM